MPLGSTVLACVAGARGTLTTNPWVSDARPDTGCIRCHRCLRTKQLWRALCSALVTLFPSQINWERNWSKSSCCSVFHVGWCRSFSLSWEKGHQASTLCVSADSSRKSSSLPCSSWPCSYLYPPPTKLLPSMQHNFFIFYPALCYQVFIQTFGFSSATQPFNQLHTDPILLFKPSSLIKFLPTSLKRTQRRRVGGKKKNSTHQCKCPLCLRSDKPPKESGTPHVQMGLTPRFAVHNGQKSDVSDKQDTSLSYAAHWPHL